MEKAFLDSEGDFDICINCAAETRYGQSEQVVKLDLVLLGHNRTISPTNIKFFAQYWARDRLRKEKRGKKSNFPHTFDNDCRFDL